MELQPGNTTIERSVTFGGFFLAGALALGGCSSPPMESKERNAPEQSSPAATPDSSTKQEDTAPQTEGSYGYDVSFPQCGTELPKPGAFAIVGVNDYLPSIFNKCASEQLEWAKKSSGIKGLPKATMYVTIANPGAEPGENGAEHIKNWPKTGSNHYGDCDNTNSAACAYEYGKKRAVQDLENVPEEITELYVDVEPEYSWTKDMEANRAAVEAVVDTFEERGKEVGVYSSADIFTELIGDVPKESSLHGLDNWVLGATTLEDARANCDAESFAGGKIVMAQAAAIEEGEIDRNVRC